MDSLFAKDFENDNSSDKANEVIDAESTIDALVECNHIYAFSPKAYALFKAALTQLTSDLEANGIYGKWQTDQKG
jgi:hypothetical protein